MNLTINLQPPLYPLQREAIFCNERYSVIEASTKAGKTVGCLQYIVDRACALGNGANHWWLAPVYKQADIAYQRLRRALKDYISLGFKFNDGDLTVLFPNGAKISFKSAEKPDNLYGEDVYTAILDEASRMREEAWVAIRSTLTATRGPIRLIGNVKGRKNFFYKLARRAQQGRKGWRFSRITAYDAVSAGVLDFSEIEDARDALPEAVFNELYLAEASDDGGNPFGLQHIATCTVPTLSREPVVCWGWDLAKSIDWTVGIGLDRYGSVAAFERWQKVPWSETISKIQRITYEPALVDATGVGDPIVEELEATGENFEGFTITSQSKQNLMEQLAVAIQKHEIRFPEGVIRDELELFEYEYTRTGVRYTAPEGYHDDTVIALALARRKWLETRVYSSASTVLVAAV